MSEEPTRLGEQIELGAEDLGFDPENLVGDTLAGRYEIEQRIGKGGMGVVYLASQSALNRKVVVKVLASNLSEDDEAVTRFEREALGLSQLQHPNIVTIYDFGRDRDLAYIVMEYVEGDTISHYLRRHGFMPFEDFAGIASQTLDALSEAHDQGIIHRDIKPSNIMLCERHGHANFVKVLDFGLAKLVNDSVEVTKKQNLVGSVAFLAPEQILGLEFDQRVDVYALGVLFYYMLTGVKPFRGEDDMSVLYQHIHKEPTPLREVLPQGQLVPEEVQALIHRCLAKDPRHRPTSARELLALLQSDVSRSVFAMPWTTGEFSAVSASSMSRPSIPQTPNPHVTPASGMTMVPTSDISGQYGHVSQHSLSSPYIYGQPPKSNRNLIIGGVAVVVVAVLAVGALMMSQQKPAGETPEQQKARLDKTLASVEGAIGEKRFGVAQTLLDSMQKELSAHPELMTRAAGYRDTIEINKLLSDAELAKNAKDFGKARALYEQILKRDATHKLATEQLAALPKATPKVAKGTVKIDSNTKARVLLDGQFIGYTPAEARVAAGKHTFEVEAKGFKNWKQEVTVEAGATQILDASLASATTTTTTSRPTSRPAVRRPTSSSSKPPKATTSNTGTKPTTTSPGKKPPKKGNDLLFPVDGSKKPSNDGGLLPVGP